MAKYSIFTELNDEDEEEKIVSTPSQKAAAEQKAKQTNGEYKIFGELNDYEEPKPQKKEEPTPEPVKEEKKEEQNIFQKAVEAVKNLFSGKKKEEEEQPTFESADIDADALLTQPVTDEIAPERMALASKEAVIRIDEQIAQLEKEIREAPLGEKLKTELFRSTPSGLPLPAHSVKTELGQKQAQLKDLYKARAIYNDIAEHPPEDAGFFREAWQGIKEGGVEAPFVGAVHSVSDILAVSDAVKKKQRGEELTDAEKTLLELEGVKQYSASERGTGYLFGATLAQMPAFVIEFVLTGGAYSLGKQTVEKGLTKVGIPLVAKRLIGTAVGAAVQTGVNVPRVSESVALQLAPEYELVVTDEGRATIESLGGEKEFSEALIRGFGNTYVEMLSERAGAVIEKPMSLMMNATLGKFMRLRGITSTKAMQEVAEKIGWNGIIGEVFEEELAELAQAPIDERPYTPLWTPEGQERLFVETLAIGTMAGVGKVTDFTISRFEGKPAEEGEEPSARIKEEEPSIKIATGQPPTVGSLTDTPALFRGAADHTVDVTRGDALSKGVSFSTDRGVADSFAARVGGEVKEYELTKKPEELKVVQATELEAFAKTREERDKWLDDNDIDVLIYDLKEGERGEGEVRIINPNIIRVKEISAAAPEEPQKAEVSEEIPDFKQFVSADVVGLTTTKTPADISSVIDEANEALETTTEPLLNRITELRTESETADKPRKAEIKTEIDRIKETVNKIEVAHEEKSLEFQTKLGLQAMKQAKKKGLDLGKIGDGMTTLSEEWASFRDDFIARVQERPYIENNFDTPVQTVVDDLVAEYQRKQTAPQAEPEKPVIQKAPSIEEAPAEQIEKGKKLAAKVTKEDAFKLAVEAYRPYIERGDTFSQLRQEAFGITLPKFVGGLQTGGYLDGKKMLSDTVGITLADGRNFTFKLKQIFDEVGFTPEGQAIEGKAVKKEPEKEEPKKAAPPKKPSKPKQKTTLSGAETKSFPKIDVEKTWRLITRSGRLQLPTLNMAFVKDGQMQFNNLNIGVSVNTKVPDGIYQIVGKDLVPAAKELAEEFPVVPEAQKEVAQMLPDDFGKRLKQMFEFTHKPEDRPVLNAVNIKFKPTKAELTATDGFTLLFKTQGIKNTSNSKEAINLGAIKELIPTLKLLEGERLLFGYNKKEGYASFSNSNGRIIVRTIEGDFPDFKRIFPPQNTQYIVDKKALVQAMKDIKSYADQVANVVKFKFEKDQIVLTSGNEQTTVKEIVLPARIKSSDIKAGSVVEGALVMPIRLSEEGEPLDSAGLNYKFVDRAAKTVDEGEVYIGLSIIKNKVEEKAIFFGGESPRVVESVKPPAPLKYFGLSSTVNDYNTSADPIAKAKMDIAETRRLIQEFPEKKEDYEKYIKEVEEWLAKKSKKGSTSSQASIDRFADIKNVADKEYYKAVEFPEILRIVRHILGDFPSVQYPRTRKTLGGKPLGLFRQEGKGKIVLNPDLFKTPEQAVKTFAHEVGHMFDWLPDMAKRGNLIGHVGSLVGFLRKDFSGYANEARIDALKAEEANASKERAKEIRKEVKRLRENPEFTLEEIDAELRKLTKMWKPFNDEVPEGIPEAQAAQMQAFIDYRYSKEEMYADAVSVLFNNPILLRENAPIFYKAFFNSLDRKPEVKTEYFNTMDLLNKGADAVLSQREKDLRAMFQKGEDLNRVKLEEQKMERHNFWFKLKHTMVDKNQAVIDLVNKAQKEGKAVSDEDNPVYWLEESRYVGGKIKAWVEDNIQPVYQDINANGLTWEDFGEVLFLERVIKERGATKNPIKLLRQIDADLIENDIEGFIEANQSAMPAEFKGMSAAKVLDLLEKKDSDFQLKMLKAMFGGSIDIQTGKDYYDEIVARLPQGIANPLGFDIDTANAQLDFLKGKLGDRYQVVERNLPKFRAAIKSILPEAAEAGLYKEKVAEKLIENPAYATFQVLDYLDTYIPASIKRQVGTLKEVSNPATATVQKTISVISAIERNKTKRSIVNFLHDNFPEEIMDAKTIWTGKSHFPVDPRDTKKWDLLTLMENGTYKGYYVDPYIAQTVHRVDTGTVEAVVGVFRFMNNKLYRPLFTTFNLGFQTFNVFRDFSRFFKNTPHLSLPRAVVEYAKAVPSAVKRGWNIPDATIKEMEKSKILSITYNDIIAGMSEEDAQIDRIIAKAGLSPLKSTKKNFFLRMPMAILDQIRNLGNTIETVPKVAAYRHLQGKMPDKKLASFIRKNVGSPDFLAGGAGKVWYNEIFLYSNAMIQGIRSDLNVATDPQTRAGYWFKTAYLTLLPKMIMFGGLIGLFGDKLREMLADVSEYDRTNYTIIPLGRDENGKTVYLRVPQDETGRFIGGILWKSLMIPKDKKLTLSDVTELFSYTGGQVPNLNPSITAVTATMQFLAGQNPYDFFRGRNVIPDQEFEAGGKYALKPFLTWQFNTLGGGVFWRGYNTFQAPETKTWLQQVTEAPLASNIIGRWIKTSDYGQKEENRKIIDELEKERSRELLEQRETIDKYVKRYQDEGGGKDLQKKLEKELVRELVGTYSPKKEEDKRTKTNVIKKFNISIVKGEADPNLDILIQANTNVEKVELLKAIKTQVSESEYKELVKTAKENKIISEDVEKEARK